MPSARHTGESGAGAGGASRLAVEWEGTTIDQSRPVGFGCGIPGFSQVFSTQLVIILEVNRAQDAPFGLVTYAGPPVYSDGLRSTR